MPKSVLQLPAIASPDPSDVLLLIDDTVSARASDCDVVAGALDTVASASNPFTSADTGKYVTVSGAGTAGAEHIGIATYISAGSITISPPAAQAVAGTSIYFTQAVRATLANLWSVIAQFATAAEVDGDSDWMPMYDTSESAIRRVSPNSVSAASSDSQLYTQESPAVEWDINHTFAYSPTVVVKNDLGERVEVVVEDISPTQVRISMNTAMAGTATLT